MIVGRGCGLVALGGGGDADVIVIDGNLFPRSCVISGRGCSLAGEGSGDACDGDPILFPPDCALKPGGWGDPNNVRHRIELKPVRED